MLILELVAALRFYKGSYNYLIGGKDSGGNVTSGST